MPLPAIPPAGLTPLSTALPSFAARKAAIAFLADDQDPVTRELRSITKGIHPVDAAFLAQLTRRFGSGAALAGGGQKFASIDKNTESAANELRFEVERIARPFVERGDLELVRVTVETAFDAAYLVVDYHNRRTGKVDARARARL